MAKQCALCDKKTVTGRQISHAHNVSSRTFKPNLQRVRALFEGSVQRIWVCTRCLRDGKVRKPPARDWRPDEAEATS